MRSVWRASSASRTTPQLVRFSQEEPERFWPAAIEDMGLEFSQPWDAVVDESNGPEWATWFVGGKLNVAWNCVHRWARGERADEEAAVWQSEDGERRALSYRELSRRGHAPRRGAGRSRRRPRRPRRASSCRCRPRSRSPRTPARTSGAIQVPIFSGFAAPAIAATASARRGEGGRHRGRLAATRAARCR